MLRKVKLSTYLSKLMKIEDCLLQSFKASFGESFQGGLLSGGKQKPCGTVLTVVSSGEQDQKPEPTNSCTYIYIYTHSTWQILTHVCSIIK
jgi:hypothetical protein